MAEIKQDLRVRKTQQALATAMLALLESSPFSKITVHDICTEALVSRSAFYAHFQDKYALLHFCMEELSKKFFAKYEDMSYDERTKKMLQEFQSNKKVLKNIIGTELDIELADMIRKNVQRDIERELSLRNRAPDLYSRHPDILTVYYAAGITHTILYWLSKNQPDSIDDLAACFTRLLAPLKD